MITQVKWSAMYAELEDGDSIDPAPVLLGDTMVAPGDRIIQIGSKKRSMFSMQDGFSLVYQGKFESFILFTSHPTGCNGNPFYYAFGYVDSGTLLVGSHKGCMDIRVDALIMEEVTANDTP